MTTFTALILAVAICELAWIICLLMRISSIKRSAEYWKDSYFGEVRDRVDLSCRLREKLSVIELQLIQLKRNEKPRNPHRRT